MEGFSAQSTTLPSGDAGVRKTVDNMRRLASEGSRNLDVRAHVLRAIQSAGVSPHNVPGQVRAWFEHVRDAVYFLNDPAGTEWLQSPAYTLQYGAGDCDDRATLLAAGLMAIGVPASFKVVAADPRRPRTFSHVYVVANVQGHPWALDPTYPDNTLGTEPRSYRTWMVPA